MISSVATVDKKHTGNPLVVVINQQSRKRTFFQPTLLLSTKTNMANTTFDDDNKFRPSVPRKFCLPCNYVERVPIKIAREIYYKAVFAGVVSRNLPTMRRVQSCLSTMKTKSFFYFWRIRLCVNWQLTKPSHRHESLRNISSPIQS